MIENLRVINTKLKAAYVRNPIQAFTVTSTEDISSSYSQVGHETVGKLCVYAATHLYSVLPYVCIKVIILRTHKEESFNALQDQIA